MAGFVPFNNNVFDISLFAFRPTVVFIDDLVEALKHLSSCSKSLGCVYSSIFKSIHGNMIIWYGAWMKRSNGDKEILNEILLSRLTDVSSMAILLDHSFFEAYAGESKDSSMAAKLSTGDTISISAAVLTHANPIDLTYACLALFKSRFLKMQGATAGVCLKCQFRPRVACLYVWKSLHLCYSWLLNFNYRKTVLPYLDQYALDTKYDIFWVVYVSSDDVQNFQSFLTHQRLENGGECQEGQVIQDVE